MLLIKRKISIKILPVKQQKKRRRSVFWKVYL